MALGGGLWITQNKVLPGTYVAVYSVARASATLSERGIATMPIEMDWGNDTGVFKVTSGDLQKDSMKIFGYEYTHEKLKGIRDLFLGAKEVLFYRLNNGGEKATNTFATAKYSGTKGNELRTIVKKNVDDETKFDVITTVGVMEVDLQTVTTAAELVANDYVTFKTDAVLTETASTPLAGGTNGEAVTSAEYQKYLDEIESYSFNAMGLPTEDSAIAKLGIAFVKRMRDEVGAKFQLVVYKQPDADYEGVVSVENDAEDENKASMVYFTTGIIAGCDINKSNTNRKYNGEFNVNVKYTQSQLAEALEKGKFIYHRVADEVRVLEDINTFVSFTPEKSADFSSNQTIRVVDQIANDIAVLFNNKYLGKVPNNANGRISLWNDIVKHHKELERLQAIEDFKAEDVKVEQGETKKAVLVTDKVTVVNSMSILYMAVYVA